MRALCGAIITAGALIGLGLTALGFGTLAAFLYSMKDITHDAQLVFSAGTVVVFVLAAAAGWGFWRLVRVLAERRK